MVSPDFLMALAHTGGYVAGLFETSVTPIDRSGIESSRGMLGCSFGMLARFEDAYVLHSHITGVIDSAQHKGLGRRLKQHQRAWAMENGLAAITWTFDPLVRRNGWFNLHCLGATAEQFHVNFYGPLGDEINGSDETDRLLAHWDLSSEHVTRATHGALPAHDPEPGDVLIATPANIVEIRRHDPQTAHKWRSTMRSQLVDAFETSHIVGMTNDGAYVLRPRAPRGES
jgi:predicted GNAT superfamily acetyltransferase